MIELRLIDKSFNMCGPSCGTGSTGLAPKKVKWYIGNEEKDITVFTDYCLPDVQKYNSKYKIAWLIEPPSINPTIYDFMKKPEIYNNFDYILTHNKELVELGDKFVFCPTSSGHWIYDKGIHKKIKLLSIIASDKKQTIGHNLRHDVINKYKTVIDGLFGRGYKQIEDKIDGLKDYMFHITIENISVDNYFSEKLIDSLVTGCIPIYYGCSEIHKYFETKGMLIFNNMEELDVIIKKYVCIDYYNQVLQNGYIKKNYELAQQYLYPEDYAYNILFKDLK